MTLEAVYNEGTGGQDESRFWEDKENKFLDKAKESKRHVVQAN